MTTFQAIDDKNECIGVYANGKLHFEDFPSNLLRTWKYSGSIQDPRVEYACLYVDGKNLVECCPEDMVKELSVSQAKMKAYVKSFKIAKINMRDHCIFDMIPHDFLLNFCEIKNKITEHVFENYSKPSNYDHLKDIQKLLHKIKYQTLELNAEGCRHLMASSSHRNKIKQLISNSNYVDYNMFGTITGRLTTKPNSFPALTIKRDYRKIVKPKNDLFVSLDYNGAEVRTLLDLTGEPQPKIDIHQWNAKNLFEQEVTREECKVRFFAWLYNPDSDDIETDYYSKEKILDKHYKNGYIYTPYGRSIKVEHRKALNYLVQSTTADRVLEKAVKIDKMLEGKKSYISFIIHDELVIDYSDEDRHMIADIKKEFEGDYLSNIKGGKDLYSLSEINI